MYYRQVTHNERNCRRCLLDLPGSKHFAIYQCTSASTMLSLVCKRSFTVAAETPRTAIARNLLRFEAVAKSNSEAGLSAAQKQAVVVDTVALPESLEGLGKYLTTSAKTASKGYVPNMNHQRHQNFFSFFAREFGKHPFMRPFFYTAL
jgi:hypothetical protein